MTPHDKPVLYSVDLCGCAIAGMEPEHINQAFIGALEGAGATVVRTLSHDFPGTGLTCILILAESHAVLHTWPETGTVNIDIFSCSTRLRSLAAVEQLKQSFGATSVAIQEVPRADGHLRSPIASV